MSEQAQTAQIKVIKSGPLHTIQDAGRFGFQRFGVTQSGPMDDFAFALAQHLVGNADNDALIEFGGFGGKYQCVLPVGTALLCAITGAEFAIKLNGEPLAPWRSFLMKHDDVLDIGFAKTGTYGYLAIKGGIDIPLVMGSRSTHTRAGLGGLEGRRLSDGDILPIHSFQEQDLQLLDGSNLKWPQSPKTIRVIMGQQADKFSKEEQEKFLTQTYKVSNKADRMGVHLEGEPLQHLGGHDVVSDGIVLGSVQIPGSGEPIVLMADRQPTGGYPKIATVILADIPKFSQMAPGSGFQFMAISAEAARQELLAYRQELQRLKRNCLAQMKVENLTSEYLLQHNLISGVVGGDEADLLIQGAKIQAA